MKRARPFTTLGPLLLLVMTATGGGARAGTVPDFNAFLDPDFSIVEESTSFVLSFSVDSTGLAFNAYDVDVRFDPAVLQIDTVDEGALMTDSGCLRYFDWDVPNDSTVTIIHSLLCAGGELNGPGELSRLTFTGIAGPPVQTTTVRIVSNPDRTFVDDGLWVWPGHPTIPRNVTFGDAVVVIHAPGVAVGDATGSALLPVRFGPNPTLGQGTFLLSGDVSGRVSIDVFSVVGRHVWRWSGAPATGAVSWSGVDTNGDRVQPGTYFYRVRSGGRAGSGRIIVMR